MNSYVCIRHSGEEAILMYKFCFFLLTIITVSCADQSTEEKYPAVQAVSASEYRSLGKCWENAVRFQSLVVLVEKK